jgi:tetratricopeptide (TPR) repeat protein
MEINRLGQSKDLAGHRAEFLMCQAAFLRFNGEEDAGLRLVEQARSGVPEAEAIYARSLLAKTSPDAEKLLREALKADPFHHAATVDLVGLLFSLGKRDEARTRAEVAHGIFPEDPCFTAWLAMIDALEGHQDLARKWCDMCRTQLAPAEFKSLEGLVALLHRLSKIDVVASTVDPKAILLDVFDLSRECRALFISKASVLTVARPAKKAGMMLPVAIVPGIFEVFNKDHARQIKQLDEVIKIHPEGTIQLLRGLLLAQDGRAKESADVCLQAATSAVLPQVRGWAYYHAAAAAGMQFDITKQNEHLDRMFEHLRQFSTTEYVTPHEVSATVPVLLRGEKYDLARALINAAERTQPQNADMIRLRVKFEMLSARQLYQNAKAVAEKNCNDLEAEELRKTIQEGVKDVLPVLQSLQTEIEQAK